MNIELSDFVRTIHERYHLSPKHSFFESCFKVNDTAPLYFREKLVYELPRYAYLCLNELQKLGSAKYEDFFSAQGLSGHACGIINNTLIELSKLGVVRAEGLKARSIVTNSQIRNADGEIKSSKCGISIAGIEPFDWKNTVYSLNDLSGYVVDID